MGAGKEALSSCNSYFLVVLQTGKQWKIDSLSSSVFISKSELDFIL